MSEEERSRLEELENNLQAHVFYLATEVGERNVFTPGSLQKAARYIRQTWEKTGYTVDAQVYTVENTECENLVVEIPGSTKPNEIVLVGAHYDSVYGSPGANDNCSAVAALLEISRLFVGRSPVRTVRFAVFSNEEPPFYRTGMMGSKIYAESCHNKRENIVAMLSLETIGYYSDEEGSQQYPVPLGFLYPDKGNFLAVVGTIKSRALVKKFARLFAEESGFPVEHVAAFSWMPGIDWSDHWAFGEYGYPAIMITDTAPYRYPYYHTAADTPEKLNYPSLSQVTHGIYRAVARLAEATMDERRGMKDE